MRPVVISIREDIYNISGTFEIQLQMQRAAGMAMLTDEEAGCQQGDAHSCVLVAIRPADGQPTPQAHAPPVR